jgi:hypothetical protein
MALSTPFTFTQTQTTLVLDVALKLSSLSANDVELADLFLKINQTPHLLALDLHAAVDLASALVTIDRDARRVLVTLRKTEAGVWPDVAVARADAEPADAFKARVAARRAESLARRAAYDQQVRCRLAAARRRSRPSLSRKRASPPRRSARRRRMCTATAKRRRCARRWTLSKSSARRSRPRRTSRSGARRCVPWRLRRAPSSPPH